jgi:hypothetical protein
VLVFIFAVNNREKVSAPPPAAYGTTTVTVCPLSYDGISANTAADKTIIKAASIYFI